MEDLHAFFQYGDIRSKNTEDRFTRHIEESGQCKCRNDRHTQAYPDSFFDSVHFSGSEVLTYKGCDGDTESTDDHPENAVDFAVCSPGSDRIRSQTVDSRLNNDIGEGIHDELQSGWKADADDPAEHPSVQTDLAEDQTVNLTGFWSVPGEPAGH